MDNRFEATYPANTRETEIARIISFIKEGNSCQLIGLPGVGRSTVLSLFAYNRAIREKHLGSEEKNYHFVRADFAEIRNKPLIDATKFLFLSLIESLGDRGFEAEHARVKQLFDGVVNTQDELVFFQGFKNAIDYVSGERALAVVYLFDRFDQYVPKLTQAFFSQLRTLRNRAKFRFSVVFSLSRPLDELIEPEMFADFYEYVAGHSVFIGLFDNNALQHRLHGLAKSTGKPLAKDTIAAIIAVTGGFGKLAKLSAEAALSQDSVPENMEQFLLGMRTVRGSLFEIWSSLTPSEQVYLEQFPTLQDEQAEKYLSLVSLVKDGEIQIQLLKVWISERVKQEAPNADEKIHFDETVNTIKKGDVVLSDQLTASEFRLLKHLLQNPEKVIDREEVIIVVWKDAKSTAGVTDQAVDQLIFRLRKKIEEDPKNPKHLQTVKGRGFKFTA